MRKQKTKQKEKYEIEKKRKEKYENETKRKDKFRKRKKRKNRCEIITRIIIPLSYRVHRNRR